MALTAASAELLRLRLSGLTYGKIATLVGVSRQRVQEVLSPPKHVRLLVQQKAGARCQNCGIPLNTHGHVHHRECFGFKPDQYQDLSNLAYLCMPCHRKAHANPKTIAGRAIILTPRS